MKNKLLSILLIFVILLSACNKKNEETKKDTKSNKSVENKIEEHTLYETFKESKESEDIWFVANVEDDGSVATDSPITTFIMSNRSHKIIGLDDKVIEDKEKKGYIFVNAVPDVNSLSVAKFSDVYTEYMNDNLDKKIYESYLNRGKKLEELWSEGWGEALFPKYAEKLNFSIAIDDKSKIKYESIQFKGIDSRFSKESQMYKYLNFNVTEGNISLPIKNNDDKKRLTYLVGVKGYLKESDSKLKYLVKFSNKQEKIIIDNLTSVAKKN